MFFGLLLVGFTLLMLIIGLEGYGLLAFGTSRTVSKRYRASAFIGVYLLPFAY